LNGTLCLKLLNVELIISNTATGLDEYSRLSVVPCLELSDLMMSLSVLFKMKVKLSLYKPRQALRVTRV
jgi:hypothetical protein